MVEGRSYLAGSRSQTFFITYRVDLPMFQPEEESMVLGIARGFFDIPSEVMMEIGETAKKALFDPEVENEVAAVSRLKAALKGMPPEHAFIAGMFVSGLLRCNLAQQMQQQSEQAMAEGGQEPDTKEG